VALVGDSEVTVELQGGLGNQLFGWATGYSLARRNNALLALNTSKLVARKFELDKFHLIDGVQVENKILANPRFGRLKKNIHLESSFAFDPKISNLNGVVTLRGYFQSWRYFDEVSIQIRDLIKISDPSAGYKKLSREFEENKTLCIHVRRGDYIHAQDYHGLTTKVYFDRAIRIANSLDEITRLAVFSDDIESAKELIDNADIYISDKDLSSPAETLLLMSKNEALIGSNSSFSWWAAYIGDSEGKSRIFPRPWFAESKIDTKDLLPKNWLTLGL
jgi:hypothetical protein